MEFVERILDKMSGVGKPQRKFLMIAFSTILLMRGKVNFRNLSRYSTLCEKTFSRQFRKSFEFARFNQVLIAEAIAPDHEKIAAIDCSYLPKSGKKTYGIDTFFDSTHNKPAKGLEISTLCIVDVTDHTAYTLSSRQTPPLEEIRSWLPVPSSKKGTSRREAEETRMDVYLHHVQEARSHLPEEIRYVVGDGVFAKYKFVEGVVGCNLDFIGKLRCDANLRYLYHGPQKSRGARRKYDGKVHFDDLSRLEEVGEVEENIHLYTGVVNSISLKRNLRIAYLLNLRDEKHPRYAVLFSTDTELSALPAAGRHEDLSVLQSSVPDRIPLSRCQTVYRTLRLPSPMQRKPALPCQCQLDGCESGQTRYPAPPRKTTLCPLLHGQSENHLFQSASDLPNYFHV